ncbi:hypothetical protein, partial [Mycobacterium sp. ACS4331]|uniref:hypothetical protein n=1 Tax=Mycobacterium sp. ACS4331 TaxID=1834121 RepID=UPI001E389B2C
MTRALRILVAALCLAGCSPEPAHDPSEPPTSFPVHTPSVNPWADSDLSAAVGAPAAVAGSLAGYAFDAGQSQHLFFAAAPDGHLREIWWDFEGWHTTDLTAATGAAEADPESLGGGGGGGGPPPPPAGRERARGRHTHRLAGGGGG